MTKNLFKFLNADDVYWADILVFNYGRLNFWKDPVFPNCLAFFKGLSSTVDIIKPFCWINFVNPNYSFVFFDPWCFEILLAFKPTFLNMNLGLVSLNFSNLVSNDSWNFGVLVNIFGNNLPFIVPSLSSLDFKLKITESGSLSLKVIELPL